MFVKVLLRCHIGYVFHIASLNNCILRMKHRIHQLLQLWITNRVSRAELEFALLTRSIIFVFGVLVLCLSATTVHVRAQVLYTKANLPTVPTTYYLQSAVPAGVIVEPGGMNINWDYSKLQAIKGVVDTVSIVDAKKVVGDVPPEANVAKINSINNKREYFNTTKPSLRSLGYEDNTTKALSGASPYDVDPIPLNLNATYSNTYDGSIQINDQPDVRIRRAGTVRFTPDGAGLLSLPGGASVVTTIRVRWEDDFVDTVYRNDVPLYSARTTRTRWIWMDAKGCTEYLTVSRGDVAFTRITEDPPADSSLSDVFYFIGGSVSRVDNEDETLFNIVPNPASEYVSITSDAIRDSFIKIELHSLTGETLYGHSLMSTSNSIRIAIPRELCASQSVVLRLTANGVTRSRILTIVR